MKDKTMKKLPDNQESKGLMIRNSTAEFLTFTADMSYRGILGNCPRRQTDRGRKRCSAIR